MIVAVDVYRFDNKAKAVGVLNGSLYLECLNNTS